MLRWYNFGIVDGEPQQVIDLHGTRYEQGFAYGKLLAKIIPEVYQTFVNALVPQKFVDRVSGLHSFSSE